MRSLLKNVALLIPPLRTVLEQRDHLLREHDALAREHDALTREHHEVIEERNSLGELRYRFEHERDVARAEVDRLAKELEAARNPPVQKPRPATHAPRPDEDRQL